MSDEIETYGGKRIDEMTREELIATVKGLSEALLRMTSNYLNAVDERNEAEKKAQKQHLESWMLWGM